MKTRVSVDQFLERFVEKIIDQNVIFLGHSSNTQVLLSNELSTTQMVEIVSGLKEKEFESCSESNDSEAMAKWIFRKSYRGKVFKIVVSIGKPEKPVICHYFDLLV